VYFDILNHLCVDHKCDRQTDGHTCILIALLAQPKRQKLSYRRENARRRSCTPFRIVRCYQSTIRSLCDLLL